MNNENYFVVQGWMINNLGLKGNDLLVYAIIYGFSQNGDSRFTGNLKYLENLLQISRSTVLRTLQKLTDEDLIQKQEQFVDKNVKYCSYKTTMQGGYQNDTPPCQNDTPPRIKMTQKGYQNDTPPRIKMTPNNNNIYNNKYNNNIYNKYNNIFIELCSENNLIFSEKIEAYIFLWLEYKKEKKQSYQTITLKRFLNKLKKNIDVYGENKVIEAIDIAIERNYTHYFPQDNKNNFKNKMTTENNIDFDFNITQV